MEPVASPANGSKPKARPKNPPWSKLSGGFHTLFVTDVEARRHSARVATNPAGATSTLVRAHTKPPRGSRASSICRGHARASLSGVRVPPLTQPADLRRPAHPKCRQWCSDLSSLACLARSRQRRSSRGRKRREGPGGFSVAPDGE
jgi:hypothetical protein